MKTRSYLALEGITVEFPTRNGSFCALDAIDLSIEKGQFVALIGHSGCGKSTLLNVVAGLQKPSRGVVFLNDEVVDGPGVDRAVVFQDHSLLPWLTVEENVRLAVDKTAKGKTKAEVEEMLGRFQALVTGRLAQGDQASLPAKLQVFSNVAQFPVRVKCASLAWHVLREALTTVKSEE